MGSIRIPASTLCFARGAEGWVDARPGQAQALWAKSGDDSGYLCLPQHLVDSACAAAGVFDIWVADSMVAFLSAQLGITAEEVRTLYLFLAGAHDVGKAIPQFQRQIDREPYRYIVSAVRDAGFSLEAGYRELDEGKIPHNVASGVILEGWLIDRGVRRNVAQRIAEIVNAHHGMASGRNAHQAAAHAATLYGPEWRAVQRELLDAMAQLTGIDAVLPKLRKMRPAPAQVIAGLVVMADWIASNADAFPMGDTQSQLQRTINGLAETDLTGPWHPRPLGDDTDLVYRDLFGWGSDRLPRPVQRAVVDALNGVDGRCLVVVEAETGVGKTEAALVAADLLASKTGAQGVYFAAPTMATANGLLERTLDWAKQAGEAGSVASMYLAHSKNSLVEPYRALRFRGIEEDGAHGSVVAKSWMSGRRKGLLSNVVVGTVDQVLMLALTQRYSMLRHTALAGKIVIFDEVHSYDAYTSDYLLTTLEWLRYYGASVILMSATLPPEQRNAMIQAYTEANTGEDPGTAYPLVTVVTEETVSYHTPARSPGSMTATVEIIADDCDTLVDNLRRNLADGGCALVLCNTIARAQDAYRVLSMAFPGEVTLHHAGFMAWERVEREDALRAALGPGVHRGGGRPWRQIVVATQVAEQSLDIDVDVLYTDIAPMDLIIQRAGRLHRHPRPATDRPSLLASPQIYLRGFEQTEPFPLFDGGATAIYDPKILMHTAALLPEAYRRPDDIAPLVHATYRDRIEVPTSWNESYAEACEESEKRRQQAHARSKTFRLPAPEDAKHLDQLFFLPGHAERVLDESEERGAAQVRDTEPTVEVIPIEKSEYGYRPLGEGFYEVSKNDEPEPKVARHLAASTVRLPARMTRYTSDFDAVVGELEDATPAVWAENYLLRGQLALPLDEQGNARIGRFWVRYTSELGLEIFSD